MRGKDRDRQGYKPLQRVKQDGLGLLPGEVTPVGWAPFLADHRLIEHVLKGEVCSGDQLSDDWKTVLSRRHSAPYLLTTSDPLDAMRHSKGGSRFWLIEGESDEDSDVEAASQCSTRSENDFIRDALQVDFSVDELIRAEECLSENVPSLAFGSVDRGSGHAPHPHPLASRIKEAVADLRLA